MTIRPDEDYARFLSEGRFMLLWARRSGHYVYPPRVAEPGSGDLDLEWVPASGSGTVYSATVIRRRPPEADYGVVLVDLDEGVRMMSRVEGVDPGAVTIGMRVRARIAVETGGPVVVFDPAEREGAA